MSSAERLPTALLAIGVRALPRAYRPRYRVELAAELRDVPSGQRLGYALRILIRSLALRSALTTYRPTIGETLMAASSSPYNHSELRRRQQAADIGHAVLGSQDRVTSWRRWKLLGMPVVVILIGLLLGQWGPVPGLGMFMVLGGAMALVLGAVQAFNDIFS